MKKLLLNLFTLGLLFSCGEEVITQNSVDAQFKSSDLESSEISTCAQMTFRKPPVDILYVIDNSGSTLANSFQEIKSQIQKTIYTVSNEFDYHMYFAPLHPTPGDNIQAYPLIVSDPDSLTSVASVNLTNSDNLSMFAQASGNNEEKGFERIKNIINNNRTNDIFRDNANTIVLMISNGNDTEAMDNVNGNKVLNSLKYGSIKLGFQKYTKQYAQSNTVTNPLNAKEFRFISLVAHESCNGWSVGSTYKLMSNDLYNYQNIQPVDPDMKPEDNPKDSFNLCSQNYTNIFKSINESINAVIDGHKYDHWKISSASESSIQQDDIIVTKVKDDGSQESIVADATNGFEYLGHKTDQKITYEPADAEEITTGLIIKLNGSARVTYPDCIIAKTRTPTEYFGYFGIPREPDLSTLKIEIDGVGHPQSSSNGWSYVGWRDTLNIKVPGPTNVSVTPAVNKSGFFIQLHGKAIFTNGQTIKVFYKPKGN